MVVCFEHADRRRRSEDEQRRYLGVDLATTNRQYGGFLGRLLFGFGVSPVEMQKAMGDPIKQQMVTQRRGFRWALAGLAALPMLMGRDQERRSPTK